MLRIATMGVLNSSNRGNNAPWPPGRLNDVSRIVRQPLAFMGQDRHVGGRVLDLEVQRFAVRVAQRFEVGGNLLLFVGGTVNHTGALREQLPSVGHMRFECGLALTVCGRT